eukprot:7383574-Prymnesium_polylepis.3
MHLNAAAYAGYCARSAGRETSAETGERYAATTVRLRRRRARATTSCVARRAPRRPSPRSRASGVRGPATGTGTATGRLISFATLRHLPLPFGRSVVPVIPFFVLALLHTVSTPRVLAASPRSDSEVRALSAY